MEPGQFCYDAYPDLGGPLYFNPAGAAGWYSAMCGLIASAVLIGLQVRLARHGDDNNSRPALISLTATLIMALLGAYVNAELAGETECNMLAVRVISSGGMLAAAAMLLLLSLAWILAEHHVPPQILRVLHLALGIVVFIVFGYMSTSVLFTEASTSGEDLGYFDIEMLKVFGPPACLVIGAGLFRIIGSRRWSETTAEQVLGRRYIQWLCGGLVLIAFSSLLITDLVLVAVPVGPGVPVEELAPDWVRYSVIWPLCSLGAMCLVAYPWRDSIPPIAQQEGERIDAKAREPQPEDDRQPWITLTVHRRRR